MKIIAMRLVVAAVVVGLAACGSDDDPSPPGVGSDAGVGVGAGGTPAPGPAVAGNVVEAAGGIAELSTLVAAIDAADLTATLSQAGSYTVLAPTNAAFDRLYTELGISQDALFANKDLLASVLRYHVIGSTVNSTDIVLGKAVEPLAGGAFKFEGSGGALPQIFDGRARATPVISADIATSNAVVHQIDRVLLPPDKNLVQFAQSQENLSFLVEAVVAADLQDALSGPGPFTLLAPTNPAFDALLGELSVNKQQLLENKALLTRVLSYHVIPGRNLRADLPIGGSVTTLQGGSIRVGDNSPDVKPRFQDERNRETPLSDRFDFILTNGVVHEIGAVLLPAP